MRKLLALLALLPGLALAQSTTGGGVRANCPSCTLTEGSLTLAGTIQPTINIGTPTASSSYGLGVKAVTGMAYNILLEGTGGVLVPTIGFKHAGDAGAVTICSYSDATGFVCRMGMPNSASTKAFVVNTNTSQTTLGGLLLSVQNASTEKWHIDKDGNMLSASHLTCAMSAGTTCTATVPTGSACMCQATAGTASAVSCAVASTTATCTSSASNSNTWNVFVY